jgi:hypothetical protein
VRAILPTIGQPEVVGCYGKNVGRRTASNKLFGHGLHSKSTYGDAATLPKRREW